MFILYLVKTKLLITNITITNDNNEYDPAVTGNRALPLLAMIVMGLSNTLANNV